jgi:hypothetical protein
MLRWLRVAPFGRPVVPDVYWMFTGSSGDSSRLGSPPSLRLSASHSSVSKKTTSSAGAASAARAR